MVDERDRDEYVEPAAYCDVCGTPLFPGDDAIYMDGDWFCNDLCLMTRVDAKWDTVGEDGEPCEL